MMRRWKMELHCDIYRATPALKEGFVLCWIESEGRVVKSGKRTFLYSQNVAEGSREHDLARRLMAKYPNYSPFIRDCSSMYYKRAAAMWLSPQDYVNYHRRKYVR
jgi:hypothetical protein